MAAELNVGRALFYDGHNKLNLGRPHTGKAGRAMHECMHVTAKLNAASHHLETAVKCTRD